MTEKTENEGAGGHSLPLLVRWVNRVTSPEGCTAVDARKLKQFNFQLGMENHNLVNAIWYICNECQRNPDDSVRDIANEAFDRFGLNYSANWTSNDREPISISPNASADGMTHNE